MTTSARTLLLALSQPLTRLGMAAAIGRDPGDDLLRLLDDGLVERVPGVGEISIEYAWRRTEAGEAAALADEAPTSGPAADDEPSAGALKRTRGPSRAAVDLAALRAGLAEALGVSGESDDAMLAEVRRLMAAEREARITLDGMRVGLADRSDEPEPMPEGWRLGRVTDDGYSAIVDGKGWTVGRKVDALALAQGTATGAEGMRLADAVLRVLAGE